MLKLAQLRGGDMEALEEMALMLEHGGGTSHGPGPKARLALNKLQA